MQKAEGITGHVEVGSGRFVFFFLAFFLSEHSFSVEGCSCDGVVW